MADDTQTSPGRRRLDLGGKPAPAPEVEPAPAPEAEHEEAPRATQPVNVFALPAPAADVHMQAPANSAPFQFEGVGFEPDAGGVVKVPAHLARALASHGYRAR